MARLGHVARTPKGLRQRVIHGAAWIFGLNMLNRGLRLARTVILARMLSPSDFGVMGVALVALGALETISETGFGSALVRKKEDIREDLDTAWTVSILRGVVLASALALGAPSVARFFETPAAASIMQALAVSFLFKGLGNIGVLYFQKDLEFRRQFIYRASSVLADALVAIPLAFILKSVWALAYGFIASAVVGCVVSYIVHPYRPRLRFNVETARGLARFGRWVTATTICFFFVTNGDNAVVGKLLGSNDLGLYTLAYRISNMPTLEIAYVVGQVTFPAYAKLQDNIPRLRAAFLTSTGLTTFVALPFAVAIFLIGPDFTYLVLGAKWAPMLPCLAVLCAFGAVRAVMGLIGSVGLAVNRPAIQTWGILIHLAVMAALIVPLTRHWGILGTSAATLAGIVIGFPAMNVLGFPLIRLRWTVWLRAIAPAVLLSALMAAVALPCCALIAGPSMARLIAIGSALAVAYLGGGWMLRPLLTTDWSAGETPSPSSVGAEEEVAG